MKKMIVCIKQIMDPEAPADSFEINPEEKAVIPGPNAAQVISPFDEHALEAALRIKDEHGGKITVLSLGYNLRREVLKKSLAMGADELILLEEEAFVGSDSWSTALPLAMAIKKIGDFDFIFCHDSVSFL
jgi:electron transfer flavoprotein beta subunit